MKKDIHLYVEKFDKIERFLLLDFVDEEEFEFFSGYLDSPVNDKKVLKTMLLCDQFSINERQYPKEGELYKIPVEYLFKLKWKNEQYNNEQSSVVAFRLDNSSSERQYDLSDMFNEVASKEQFIYKITGNWNAPPCGAEQLSQNVEAIIKNVGQGSWNEIVSQGKCKLIFDFGASIFYSSASCKELLKSNSFDDKPSLIISHWDVDHYNLLTVTTDSDLNKICCAYVPSECITLTSKGVAKRLEVNCNYLCSIEPELTRIVKRKVSLHQKFIGKQYIVFAGESSNNRNLSGLALIVWTNNCCVFFCADHSYYQVFNDMNSAFEKVNCSSIMKKNIFGEEHILHLIVPHHGGYAGNIENTFSPYKPGHAVVSTGQNNYGHPKESVRSDLCKIGFKWSRLDYTEGDFLINM